MENKQTAVDFFYNEVWLCFSNKLSWTECDRLTKIKEQAKEMEKEQIIEAYIAGSVTGCGCYNYMKKEDGEDYCKKTYGVDK